MDKFNLQEALNGASVTTKDGRLVTNIKVVDKDAPHSAHDVDEHNDEAYSRGLIGTIHNKCGECVYPFYHDGGSHKYGGENLADLIMAKSTKQLPNG